MSVADHSPLIDLEAQTIDRPNRPVLIILRAEAAIVLAAATTAYALIGSGWLLFALLFFVPDVFMLGYLKNARVGAHVYNLGHSYVTPAAVFVGAKALASPLWAGIALIWIAHIAFDRLVGYGLKLQSGFNDTHLTPRADQAA
ncbi:MAG: DUF4260 domain-containing protein [Beijerinckiaceae bacterium]|nr:DUF4260 domain-containing protein [Beijerinckiaceae bacterium]